MIFELSKLFFKDTHKRLRPSDQAPAKGVLGFLNRPSVGLAYWVLVWLAAFLLQMVPTLHEVGNGARSVYQDLGLGERIRLAPGRDSPVTIVSADTGLVERGQKVDAATAEIIRMSQARIRDREPFSRRVWKLTGDGMLLLLGLGVTAVLFRFVKSNAIPRNSMILLFLLVSLLSLAPSKWLLWMDFSRMPWLYPGVDALLPLALAPLLMALLVGPMAGLVAGFWVSYAAAIMADYQISVLMTGLIVTAVVGRTTRAVRTRSKLFRIGLWAGLAGAAGTAGFAAIRMPGLEYVVTPCLASLASGVLSALVAMLLLPLLEIVFGISTDISLLELADLEHPLLKRLAIEAPGTYHHSLMVANLTQAAVAAIGGNALRAGICAYFHDIGKLVKPSFFSENIRYGENPHDDLSPSMSTLVIISHVKEGVNLALRHKLPQPVVDAIQQHHGSGLVFYFYHKANIQREQASPDAEAPGVQEENFRYPGPRPQSREIAVLSLADAIEAASRSLEKVTPGNMEDLVSSVIDSKLQDGQLDLCDLTMDNIYTLRRVLLFTLSNIMHGRIAYPRDENNRPQPADAVPPERV